MLKGSRVGELQALEAGKHVCIENPLALDAVEARNLYDLADKVDRTLHVQHIELLSFQHQVLREKIDAKCFTGARVKSVEVRASGPVLPASAGPLPFSGISRLHTCVSLSTFRQFKNKIS